MGCMKNLFQLLAVVILVRIPIAGAMDLLEAYDLALVNDPAFLEAAAQYQFAQEFRPQAIANFLPNVSAVGTTQTTRLHNKKTGTFQSRTGVGKTQNFWTNSIRVDLIQPIFNIESWVQYSQSENQIAQADAEYGAVEQDTVIRTTDAYLNILLARDTLEFSKFEKRAFGHQLEQAKQRFEMSLIAIADVLEIQAEYDKSVADAIEAENDLDDRKEELREIIGESPVDLAGLGTDLPLLKPNPEEIGVWTKLAKTYNLNIIARQNQAEYAKKNIEGQRSGHYPTLDLVGSYAYQDDNSSFGLRGDTGKIGLELNVPLFQGGNINSRTRQALSEYHIAQQQLVAVRRSVIRLVKSGYRGVISTISQVKARAATVRSSKSALEATRAGFEVGIRTSGDVITEQRNLSRSKWDHAEARYEYIRNWLRLKVAVSDLSRNDLEKFNRLLTKRFERGKVSITSPLYLDRDVPNNESRAPLSGRAATQTDHKKTSSQSDSRREDWILAQDPKQYTVQLAAFWKETGLKSFLSKSEIRDDLGFFSFKREGRTWHAVIYGVFEQYEQALQASRALPKHLKTTSPWVRKFSAIQRLSIR